MLPQDIMYAIQAVCAYDCLPAAEPRPNPAVDSAGHLDPAKRSRAGPSATVVEAWTVLDGWRTWLMRCRRAWRSASQYTSTSNAPNPGAFVGELFDIDLLLGGTIRSPEIVICSCGQRQPGRVRREMRAGGRGEGAEMKVGTSNSSVRRTGRQRASLYAQRGMDCEVKCETNCNHKLWRFWRRDVKLYER